MKIHRAPGQRITFRGCTWDAGWEFDSPAIVYFPAKSYNSNHGGVEQLVEDMMIDFLLGDELRTKWDVSELKEFRWRRWAPTGFAKRINARHVEMTVEIIQDGEHLSFITVETKEQNGPFKRAGGTE